MSELKLMALDADDLQVISAHLQDALAREADMAYASGDERFALILNRFDWTDVPLAGSPPYVRRRAALRFNKVSRAQVQNLTPGGVKVHELLAIQFEPGDMPSGAIILIFAGGSGLRLEVECIEAELRDLGAAWATNAMPRHPAPDSVDH